MKRKKNPAEPKLDRVKLSLPKLRLFNKLRLWPAKKKDYLNEYLRRSKSAGS
jgi:hypothetical protein